MAAQESCQTGTAREGLLAYCLSLVGFAGEGSSNGDQGLDLIGGLAEVLEGLGQLEGAIGLALLGVGCDDLDEGAEFLIGVIEAQELAGLERAL